MDLRIPGSDTALMMALVHTLVAEGLHDRAFLDRYTVGWPVFERYLLGETDGQPKDAAWAAPITGVSADAIVALARRLHGKRALIVVAHALQRAEHGEQPVWMGMVLAAALGQIGLPGGGYAYALGAIAYYGRRFNAVPMPTFSQGRNGVRDYIPVARIADMLLNPGDDLSLQWRDAGPIPRSSWSTGPAAIRSTTIRTSTGCASAFAQVDTLVVHELAWTATARHADIVLPCTMTLEREDIGGSSNDPLLVPMQPDRAALWRGARRLRDLRRSRRAAGRARGLHGRPHGAPMAGASLRADARGARGAWACRRRASTSSGRATA